VINFFVYNELQYIPFPTVLFPLMGIEIGMEIIYFHSEK